MFFLSNSKFDQNLECSSLKFAQLITKKFSTCHDSYTVVMCAEFHSDRYSAFEARARQIMVEFRNIISGTGAWSKPIMENFKVPRNAETLAEHGHLK